MCWDRRRLSWELLIGALGGLSSGCFHWNLATLWFAHCPSEPQALLMGSDLQRGGLKAVTQVTSSLELFNLPCCFCKGNFKSLAVKEDILTVNLGLHFKEITSVKSC